MPHPSGQIVISESSKAKKLAPLSTTASGSSTMVKSESPELNVNSSGGSGASGSGVISVNSVSYTHLTLPTILLV